jgi:hypothetical protein
MEVELLYLSACVLAVSSENTFSDKNFVDFVYVPLLTTTKSRTVDIVHSYQ